MPYRIDLAGGWLDQPFVSRHYPGAVITVSIEPIIEFNERSGMASSTRRQAVDLWGNRLPVDHYEKLARILFCCDNLPGTENGLTGLYGWGILREVSARNKWQLSPKYANELLAGKTDVDRVYREEINMSTIEHVTLSELQDLLQSLQLPPNTRLTVQFEDAQSIQKAMKQQAAVKAMEKLKGSGNGNLVAALLAERKKEALL